MVPPNVLTPGDVICVVPLALCAIALTIAVISDARSRIIPKECCWAIALAGGTFQCMTQGLRGLVQGALIALLVLLLCCLLNNVASKKGEGGSSAVGGGDVRLMMALSILCGTASLEGAVAAYGLAALVCLGGLLLRKFNLQSGIPMAPFLALWAVVGVALCLAK